MLCIRGAYFENEADPKLPLVGFEEWLVGNARVIHVDVFANFERFVENCSVVEWVSFSLTSYPV
jgi:hypothetical protein